MRPEADRTPAPDTPQARDWRLVPVLALRQALIPVPGQESRPELALVLRQGTALVLVSQPEQGLGRALVSLQVLVQALALDNTSCNRPTL
jgi:hypothetical protein